MDERRVGLWARLARLLLEIAIWLFSIVLMFWSFFSLADEPMKAVALAVLALYFQRAADGMNAETRRTNREEMSKAA